MEENSSRPAQGEPLSVPDASSDDWRSQISPENRQRLVNKILGTLKEHVPYSEPECVNELQKLAYRFEEKMYTSAANLHDYLKRMSRKMLSLPGEPGQINPSINQHPVDSATLGIDNLSLQ